MRVFFKIIIPMVLALLGVPPSYAETPQCGSFVFSIEMEGKTHLIDVATLRQNRQELYELLRNNNVRGYYFSDELTYTILLQDKLNTAALPTQEQKEKFQRYVKFMLKQTTPFIDEIFWSCGSFIDNMAGELSLRFTKAEGDELVKLLGTPLADRFLKFSWSTQRTSNMPKEIFESFTTTAFPKARASLVANCIAEGFEVKLCERMLNIPSPPVSGTSNVQSHIPPALRQKLRNPDELRQY